MYTIETTTDYKVIDPSYHGYWLRENNIKLVYMPLHRAFAL